MARTKAGVGGEPGPELDMLIDRERSEIRRIISEMQRLLEMKDDEMALAEDELLLWEEKLHHLQCDNEAKLRLAKARHHESAYGWSGGGDLSVGAGGAAARRCGGASTIRRMSVLDEIAEDGEEASACCSVRPSTRPSVRQCDASEDLDAEKVHSDASSEEGGEEEAAALEALPELVQLAIAEATKLSGAWSSLVEVRGHAAPAAGDDAAPPSEAKAARGRSFAARAARSCAAVGIAMAQLDTGRHAPPLEGRRVGPSGAPAAAPMAPRRTWDAGAEAQAPPQSPTAAWRGPQPASVSFRAVPQPALLGGVRAAPQSPRGCATAPGMGQSFSMCSPMPSWRTSVPTKLVVVSKTATGREDHGSAALGPASAPRAAYGVVRPQSPVVMTRSVTYGIAGHPVAARSCVGVR